VTYRDYLTRLADAKVQIDGDSGGVSRDLASEIAASIRYYALAGETWQQKIMNLKGDRENAIYTVLSRDKTCDHLQPVRSALISKDEYTRFEATEAAVPAAWSCASDHLAEAEILGSRK